MFRRTKFFDGRGDQLPDVWWMRPDGRRMTRRDWDNPDSRAIGVFLNGDELQSETRAGEEVRDDSFLLLFNSYFDDVTFRLPARRLGLRWQVEFQTGRFDADRTTPGAEVVVQGRSLVVLRRV